MKHVKLFETYLNAKDVERIMGTPAYKSLLAETGYELLSTQEQLTNWTSSSVFLPFT